MKIITTVGMSLILNSDIPFDSSFERENFRESLFEEKETKMLEASLLQFANQANTNASAELASLAKIDPRGEAEIHLLCTETVLSYLCGRVLKKKLGERAKIQTVTGLQVKNLAKFKREGVSNLLNAIERIAQQGTFWDDVVLNITGGYKAITPIMTIIGQVQKLRTFYIFQENDNSKYDLIEIPPMPIDFRIEIFEQYEKEFEQFGEKGDGLIEKSHLSYDFSEECSSCLETEGEVAALNSIGQILWRNYRQQFFSFNTNKDVWCKIQNQPDIQRILKTKFYNQNTRLNKTEQKKDHYVFDDGDNNNRIYYFIDNEKVYVYQTFENEEKAQAFISTPFSEQNRKNFMLNSESYRISIKR